MHWLSQPLHDQIILSYHLKNKEKKLRYNNYHPLIHLRTLETLETLENITF